MDHCIVPLDQRHDVSGFDCGVPALNSWLQTMARQHKKKSLSSTFVLVNNQFPNNIIGFYALAIRGMTSVEQLPPLMAKKLPANVPSLTLARLAVAVNARKNAYGELLLVDAMHRAKQVASQVGGVALFVDAKDANIAAFYAKFGFQPLVSEPLTLFIDMAAIGD